MVDYCSECLKTVIIRKIVKKAAVVLQKLQVQVIGFL